MPKVRLADGTFTDVDLSAIFADDGTTPFTPTPPTPTEPVFTAADIEKARQQEKDKLYPALEDLRNQVGTLTAAQQAEKERLEAQAAQQEAEARAAQEADLDVKTLFERRQEEWKQQIESMNQDWSAKFAAEQEQRALAEAQAQKEREFNNLRDYIATAVDSNKDRIAPQLVGWVNGNTQEEVDAAVARAIATTDEIAAEFQQLQGQQPQQTVSPYQQATTAVGTHVTAPVGSDPNQQFQTLTAEQIANMPMDQYAQLRGKVGIGAQSTQRGLFG